MARRLIEHWLAKLGSRKFWVWVAVIALATTGLYTGKLDSRAWVDIVSWVSGIYLGVNAVQKLFLRGTDK